MFRRLTEFIRQKVEQNNHRPRILYADRSLWSKILMVITYIAVLSWFIDIVFVIFVIFSDDVPVSQIINPKSVLITLIQGVIGFFSFFPFFVFAKFFDLSFWDFLKSLLINILVGIVFLALATMIQNPYIINLLNIPYYYIMSFYIYPTKFLRVYSDYNTETDNDVIN